MKTVLIVYVTPKGLQPETVIHELGPMDGKTAREEVAKKAVNLYGCRPRDVAYTPKVVAGVRFYIAVHKRRR